MVRRGRWGRQRAPWRAACSRRDATSLLLCKEKQARAHVAGPASPPAPGGPAQSSPTRKPDSSSCSSRRCSQHPGSGVPSARAPAGEDQQLPASRPGREGPGLRHPGHRPICCPHRGYMRTWQRPEAQDGLNPTAASRLRCPREREGGSGQGLGVSFPTMGREAPGPSGQSARAHLQGPHTPSAYCFLSWLLGLDVSWTRLPRPRSQSGRW